MSFRRKTVSRSWTGALAVFLLASTVASARAQEHHGHDAGRVDFPVSCSPEARAEVERAVALLHHMTYPQAREAFQHAAEIDPHCAMAHWGVAMTLFQPLWPTRPGPAALRQGWEEVQKAEALEPPTERERLFVDAVKAFFLEPESTDYWLRVRRWETASAKVYAAFPDDLDAAAFYALSILASSPADAAGAREHADRAAAILERVYDRNPNHPGAMHYLVHANDVPGRERDLLDVTRRYATIAPDNPHALHMPTHIFTRLGDWDASIRGNTRAALAALRYPAGEHGEYVWDEFPHAIEYLVYAYLQQGADDAALAQLERLHLTAARIEPTTKTAFHLASAPARYALERGDWAAASAIVPREPATIDWDRFAWPEAIARFARGLGSAHLGRLDEARACAARIEALESATRAAGEEQFAKSIQILRLELSGWLAHAEGHEEAGLALVREAAELEASTPKPAVTPGPTLPANQLLGDLLMELKRPAEALASYRRAIELYPKRFNSVLGAARAARALGDRTLASAFYRELLAFAAPESRRPALAEARSYVAHRARR